MRYVNPLLRPFQIGQSTREQNDICAWVWSTILLMNDRPSRSLQRPHCNADSAVWSTADKMSEEGGQYVLMPYRRLCDCYFTTLRARSFPRLTSQGSEARAAIPFPLGISNSVQACHGASRGSRREAPNTDKGRAGQRRCGRRLWTELHKSVECGILRVQLGYVRVLWTLQFSRSVVFLAA